MKSQWDTWLRELAAAGKGGAIVKAIDRGLPYSLSLEIPMDVSADAFAASLKVAPDAASAEADFTVGVGAYAAGVTVVTLSLSAALTAALTADGDADGVEELVFDLLHTPSGGTQQRFIAGAMPILGKVTDYGS